MKTTDECLDSINQANGYQALNKAVEKIKLDAFIAGMRHVAKYIQAQGRKSIRKPMEYYYDAIIIEAQNLREIPK